jgi:hypothetical protein
MSLITQPTIKDDKIIDTKSLYQPTDDILARAVDVKRDYKTAQDYIDQTWSELNGCTIYDRAGKDQEMFNGNTPLGSGDPSDYWKANTVNPMVRNRCISIMAHLIQAYLYPTIIAQNEQSEEDKDASIAFGDMVEWALEQAHYSEKMMQILYAFISEPIVVIKMDYVKATRKIKKELDEEKDGKKWEYQEINDDEFGGFQLDIIPYDEIYFGNIHEVDIQKQPFIITRRIIDYTQAQIKYEDTPNFRYVTPGKYTFFNEHDTTFYEKDDENLNGTKVYEDTYYNRFADLELVYINGILVHNDPDRPMRRMDKKYQFAETGYERIHNRFIIKKSLVSKLASVQIDLNDLWNAVKDMARYQATPATFSYGFEEMDNSVVIPGMNTNTQSKEAGVVPINNGSDLSGALRVIQMLEGAQNESSQAPLQQGVDGGGNKTKYEVQRLEANAQTVLGLSGEMLGHLVKQLGELALGLVLQHIPIADIGEITDTDAEIKMMPIILPNRQVSGKTVTRKIEFTTDMPVNEKDEMKRSFDLLDEESSKEMSIFKMNPAIMERLKLLVKVEPTFMDRQTKITRSLGLYDRMLANPLAQQNPQIMEAVTRDLLLGQLVPGEEYKYLPSGEQPIDQMARNIMEQQQKPMSKPKNKLI